MSSDPAPKHTGPFGVVRNHPGLTLLMLGCTIGGAALGVLFWDAPDWSLGRKAWAGSLAGFGCALLVTGTRYLGAFRE